MSSSPERAGPALQVSGRLARRHGRLSVALATFNGGAYLAPQLDSLAAQTCPPDELVVCDDGSTDGTLAILDRFAQRVPFPVRIFVNAARLGSTKNFEQAIGICDGDILALCDQDDIWRPDKLDRLAASFADSRVGAVFSDAELIDDSGRLVGRRLWPGVGFTRAKQRRLRHGNAFDVLVAHNVVTGATLAFRAAYREQFLPIPPTWVHDGWIAIIVAALAEVAVIAEPLMQYRVHARQTVGIVPHPLRTALRALWNDSGASHAIVTRVCATAAEQSAIALERLESLTDLSDRSHRLAQLSAKVDHLRARSALPHSRLARVRTVAGELIARRYHRYSLGFRSALRDLMI